MKYISVVIVWAFLFTGCSSTTTTLEDYKNDPNGMWVEGKKLSEKGDTVLSKGETTIENSRIEATKGKALIESGNNTIVSARHDYQLQVAKIGVASSPKEVIYESKRLKAIGDKWSKAIANVKKGEKIVTKSEKMNADGQALVNEGRKLLDKGNNFIRNSQRMKLEESELTETVVK